MTQEDWTGALASALHNTSDQEDDSAPLNVMSSSGLTPVKVPLNQWPNLVKARTAVQDVRLDKITAEEFIAQIKPLDEMADNGIRLFAVDAIKDHIAKLPPDQMEVANNFASQLHTLKEGTTLMVSYATSKNIDELDKGLALVETCMANADKIQDVANFLGDKEMREQAAAEAEAEQT